MSHDLQLLMVLVHETFLLIGRTVHPFPDAWNVLLWRIIIHVQTPQPSHFMLFVGSQVRQRGREVGLAKATMSNRWRIRQQWGSFTLRNLSGIRRIEYESDTATNVATQIMNRSRHQLRPSPGQGEGACPSNNTVVVQLPILIKHPRAPHGHGQTAIPNPHPAPAPQHIITATNRRELCPSPAPTTRSQEDHLQGRSACTKPHRVSVPSPRAWDSCDPLVSVSSRQRPSNPAARLPCTQCWWIAPPGARARTHARPQARARTPTATAARISPAHSDLLRAQKIAPQHNSSLSSSRGIPLCPHPYP